MAAVLYESMVLSLCLPQGQTPTHLYYIEIKKKKKEKLLFSKAVYHFIESLEPLCESTALKTR